ncbi:ribosomal protein L1 [Schizopora paradoxa]|uniref:Ribosomal L1 domain-containing protein 1 n=1 Tax=Schizopora paradoxa TaxID=27342 RepID=A0A0H2R8I6_9AGAM|nr:ribosomal protein L1 [Schizopora paradoxa]
MTAKTSPNALVDEHVSLAQCKKAVVALRNYALKVAKEKEETELIPGKEENIWLVLTVKKMQPEKKLKPFKIPLAHPVVDPRSTPVCLITKDPQREYKDLLASNNVKFISRVVGVAKLKGKFKPFEARRMLLKENGLFLADERVVPLLPGLLGKIFFEAKKQPIPVCLTRKDLKGELERAISSTYMHQNQGTCTSIKIGTVSQTPAQLLDNIKAALPAIVKRIQGGWENVQSFNIKTNSSVSLPVWSCNLGSGEEARWSEVVEEKDAKETEEGWTGFGGDDEEDDEEDDEVVQEEAKTAKAKGKRKAVEGDEVAPSKKAKKERKAKEVEPAPSSEKTPVVAEKTKKKESKKATKDAPEESKKKAVEPVEEAPAKPDEKRKRRKSNASKEDIPAKSASTAVEPPTPKSKATSQKTKDVEPAPSKAADITPSDLKKKRSEKGIEKKKEVVTKAGKKSLAKKEILGKTAKVRF